MKYLKTYENYFQNELDKISPEFWEMVEITNWDLAIKGYLKSMTYHEDYMKWTEEARFRLYSRYSFEQVRDFYDEYIKIYDFLGQEFNEISYKCDVSDDGWSDLLSSVIGRGKEWIKKCLDNPKLVIKMGKKGDYIENFGYLFNIDEDDYWDIIAKFDPNNIGVTARKYNL